MIIDKRTMTSFHTEQPQLNNNNNSNSNANNTGNDSKYSQINSSSKRGSNEPLVSRSVDVGVGSGAPSNLAALLAIPLDISSIAHHSYYTGDGSKGPGGAGTGAATSRVHRPPTSSSLTINNKGQISKLGGLAVGIPPASSGATAVSADYAAVMAGVWQAPPPVVFKHKTLSRSGRSGAGSSPTDAFRDLSSDFEARAAAALTARRAGGPVLPAASSSALPSASGPHGRLLAGADELDLAFLVQRFTCLLRDMNDSPELDRSASMPSRCSSASSRRSESSCSTASISSTATASSSLSSVGSAARDSFRRVTDPDTEALRDYVATFVKRMDLDAAVLVTAIVLIRRLALRYPKMTLCTKAARFRVAVTTVLLANKLAWDEPFCNRSFARLGKLSLSSLNAMEVELLKLHNFELHVDPADLDAAVAELLAAQRTSVALASFKTDLVLPPINSPAPVGSSSKSGRLSSTCNSGSGLDRTGASSPGNDSRQLGSSYNSMESSGGSGRHGGGRRGGGSAARRPFGAPPTSVSPYEPAPPSSTNSGGSALNGPRASRRGRFVAAPPLSSSVSTTTTTTTTTPSGSHTNSNNSNNSNNSKSNSCDNSNSNGSDSSAVDGEDKVISNKSFFVAAVEADAAAALAREQTRSQIHNRLRSANKGAGTRGALAAPVAAPPVDPRSAANSTRRSRRSASSKKAPTGRSAGTSSSSRKVSSGTASSSSSRPRSSRRSRSSRTATTS